MKIIKTIITIYFSRSSRTIETIMISDLNKTKFFYIYNYEGYSFRVFETKKAVSDFFNLNIESLIHFDNENNLDKYLLSFEE